MMKLDDAASFYTSNKHLQDGSVSTELQSEYWSNYRTPATLPVRPPVRPYEFVQESGQ